MQQKANGLLKNIDDCCKKLTNIEIHVEGTVETNTGDLTRLGQSPANIDGLAEEPPESGVYFFV